MGKKIKIEVRNNKCKLYGNLKHLLKIQKEFKVRHPNAFWVRKNGYAEPGWDGKINYVTDSWYFKTGLITQVHEKCKELGFKVKFIDRRTLPDVKYKIPKKVGDKKARPEQIQSIKALLENKVGNLNLPFGVINGATNFGKTLAMAMVYLSYKRKVPAIMLINDADLYEQFKTELPELLGDDVGFVKGKEKNWGKFTVAMVPTLSRNIKSYNKQLSKFGIVLVDECDLANNKTYKTVITHCYNSFCRCGLSGSVFLSKLKKDLPKNQNLRSFFGEQVYEITKKEMVDAGYSTDIVIRIYAGNKKPGIKKDYKAEYDRCITNNEQRTLEIVDRVRNNVKRGRIPLLIVCRYRNHTESTWMAINNAFPNLKTEFVHGDVKERKTLIKKFRDGDIDILVSSMIVKRGKNFPLLKTLINAAGGDSHETVLQIMGRLERKDDSKKKGIMEDFFDEGVYLARHSRHRVLYYKKQGFKVKEYYK